MRYTAEKLLPNSVFLPESLKRAIGILSSEQDALYEIEQALHRIRDGTYGICELSGKRIESERLQAIPWARFTAAAEKQLEKEGAVTRHRLGPRDTVPRERSK